MTVPPPLRRALGGLEYFTFGFGTMIGVGWVVVMDDWLGRGGPAGAMLGFLLGGVLLLPIARTYGRLVQAVPDAGAEIAYAERVFPPLPGFAAGWMMFLAYAIVCPWEAVAIGNVLARLFPAMNDWPLYAVAGKTITAPRLVAGLFLTGLIGIVNIRGIRLSGRFQDITTLGLLACFAVFVVLGFANGSPANVEPLFARAGTGGMFLSIVLASQIVPYFMTGFESVVKGSEEAREGFAPPSFGRAMTQALLAGAGFYVVIIAAVAFVFPWQDLVTGHLGTEKVFAQAFGSTAIARFILFAALLSLFKCFNGNFVAASRMLYAMGRRHLVHPALGAVQPRFGTPATAIALLMVFTAAGAFIGDALLVPITEVGSLAAGVGWFAACLAALKIVPDGRRLALIGVLVSVAIILMKTVPLVPGSFTAAEWAALAGWCALGLACWLFRPRA